MRWVSGIFGGLLLGLMAVLLPVRASEACTIKLGWEQFPPFQVRDGSDATGLDLELFRGAADLAGCRVVTREMPWRRLLRALESGDMDAAMGASITPERAAFAFFSDTYRVDDFVLFVRRGEVEAVGPIGLADIVGKRFRLGTVGGYSYGETFDALMQDPRFARQVQAAPTTALNLRKMVAGRIDGFIENHPVGVDIARKEGLQDRIEVHPVPVSADPAHFMFSKASVPQALVDTFNQALEQLRESGRYNEILDKYLK